MFNNKFKVNEVVYTKPTKIIGEVARKDLSAAGITPKNIGWIVDPTQVGSGFFSYGPRGLELKTFGLRRMNNIRDGLLHIFIANDLAPESISALPERIAGMKTAYHLI